MNRNGDFLKFLAMFTMLIDHIGYLFFPTQIWIRVIGRISFPIFAFLIARGYRFTSSKQKYALRLLAFGFISQVPYHFFAPGKLNIMFTLLIGLFIIEVFDSKYKLLSIPLLFIGHFLPLSYGVYGLAMILIFHMTYGDHYKTLNAYILLTLAYYLQSKNGVQALSFLALIPILVDPKTSIKVPRMVGYWFYPGHIAALLLIKQYFYFM